MGTTEPTPSTGWSSTIPTDIWQTAVQAMPWFNPRGRRKRLCVEWHARFVPPDNKSVGMVQAFLKLQNLQHLIESRRLEVRRKALELQRRRQRQILKIATAIYQMGKSPEDDRCAQEVVKRMRFTSAEKEAVFNEVKDFIEGKWKPSPPSPPDSRPPRTVATLNREGRLLEERSKVDDFVTGLARAALKGDRASADNLKAIAEYATMQLMVATRAKPEVFRSLAAACTLWPVMASTNPHWVRTAEQTLTSIDFGAETLHAKVKPALAFDQQVPARRWARQAIETLELNRERFADPGMPESALVALKGDHDVQLRPVPHWAYSAGRLPPLTRRTAKEWATLSREMIRDQVPQLEKHADWKFVARRFEHLKGKDGIIRNKVLDAIGSALGSLVQEGLPKIGSSNSASDKR